MRQILGRVMEKQSTSTTASWWTGKDERQRWSYGSDSDIPEPSNWLCCSPVDSSENEDVILMVNNLGESEDDHDDDDEPIDYSKRYTTDNTRPKLVKKRTSFGDYAETDLDQPTNYSLMYAEEDNNDQFFIVEQEDDTPMTYCTEGTPYEGCTPCNFSTATSMSDLRLIDDKESTTSSKKKTAKVKPIHRKEKELKGNNSAQETPLIFSRSSSVDSLSEFDQDLRVQDDRSSIVSDFSHRTSVVVSPSELPDSPTQTVMPKVSPGKPVLRVPPKMARPLQRPTQQYKMNPAMKHNVFEDSLVRFKDEQKLRSPAASSLSSLSIDDPLDECDNRDISQKLSSLTIMPKVLPQPPTRKMSPRIPPLRHCCEKQPQLNRLPEMTKRISVFEDTLVRYENERALHSTTGSSLSSLTIDDEPKLMDSKSIAMKIANLSQNSLPQKLSVSPMRVVRTSASGMHHRAAPIMRSQSPTSSGLSYRDSEDDDESLLGAYINTKRNDIYRQSVNTSNRSVRFKQQQQQHHEVPKTYCTEGTPIYISRCGSRSNLSMISGLNSESLSPGQVQARGISGTSSDCSEEEQEVRDQTNDSRLSISPFDSRLNLRTAIHGERISAELSRPNSQPVVSSRNYYGSHNNSEAASVYDISDSSEEDDMALEECIRSGFSKVTRRQ